MRRTGSIALLIALLAAAPAVARAQGAVPTSSQMVSLSLVDTLVSIDEADLAGLFAFIPGPQAPMALAHYLMKNRAALKRFLKKVEKDFKKAKAINEWDKDVLLYLVGLNSASRLPFGMERLPKKLTGRVNELALKPALPLGMIQQRKTRK